MDKKTKDVLQQFIYNNKIRTNEELRKYLKSSLFVFCSNLCKGCKSDELVMNKKYCQKCINEMSSRAKRQQEEMRKQNEISRADMIASQIKSTKTFIEAYLNHNAKWNEGIRLWDKFNELQHHHFISNAKEIRSYIKNMPYQDFLKTPDWIAIRDMVKYKNKYKCQTCSNPNKKILHVHHPDYDIHGEEILNTKRLTVVCEDCHHLLTFKKTK